MAYLISQDYLRTIQDVNLQQIISSNASIQYDAEIDAQSEAISYLKQKYDVSKEFTDTVQWAETDPYSAHDRVYLNADAYVAATTYSIGAYVVNASKVYRCNTNGTTGVFDATKWDLKGNQYQIFYALYPFPLFNLQGQYKAGDKVYWEGKVYSCSIPTAAISHETSLQYYQVQNLPYVNVFPNDVSIGATYWAFVEDYLIPANTDILLESVWTSGDNRDRQMVRYLIDIALFHLHSRIAPRNIPQLRIDRYKSALQFLKDCARGEITPALPLLQPRQGNRIRWGGNVRNINSY